MSVWWLWQRRKKNWTILPQDVHWTGFEMSFIVRDGYEPFGVTDVPNTTDPNQKRIWTRRRDDRRKYLNYEIKVQSGGWGGHQVLLHLSDRWEPFAVSDSSGNHIIWFRRKAEE